jgi:hypothetical protein
MTEEYLQNKFIDEIDIDEYEVLTPNGWKDFNGICKTIPFQVYVITFDDCSYIECADTHVFMYNNEEIFAKNLLPGHFINSINGKKEIISIEITDRYENMYDLRNVDGGIYYTNDVVSHNTTTTGSYALWYSIFNDNKTIGIVSNKQVSAIDIMNRVKRMYQELPMWMKPGITEWSKTFVSFDNNTKIMVSATSEDAFRGRTLNLMIADEYAFVPKHVADAFWAANYPTISASVDAKIIIISTPHGLFGTFHTLYSQAERGENSFKHFKSSWIDVPGRDEEWANVQKKNLGLRRFAQEYQCVDGETYIKVWDLVDKIEKTLKIKDLYNLL